MNALRRKLVCSGSNIQPWICTSHSATPPLPDDGSTWRESVGKSITSSSDLTLVILSPPPRNRPMCPAPGVPPTDSRARASPTRGAMMYVVAGSYRTGRVRLEVGSWKLEAKNRRLVPTACVCSADESIESSSRVVESADTLVSVRRAPAVNSRRPAP